jgi:F-type H+-transporting ATPase subunit a
VQKRGCLGCSFPVFIIILVIAIALLLIGFISGPIGSNLFPNIELPSWITISQPEPELPAEAVFHIGSFAVTNTIIASWLTIIFLVLFFWLVARKSKLIPGRLQALIELVLGWLLNLCESVAGEENGRKFFPVVSTIFLYVLLNAWLSLLPFFNAIIVHTHEGEIPLFRGASTDANLPLALAIVSFIFVTYFGFKTLGFRFVESFFNFRPLGHNLKDVFRGKVKSGLGGLFLSIINLFVGFIEFIAYMIRLVSFTFRLFGNMTAGEILLAIVMFLIPYLIVPVFYGLELIIGVIQAFIFGGLTLVFATMAITPHSEEHA